MVDTFLNDPSASYKINLYPNAQQPGTLWYHDHSMSVTKANVGMGLYGFYIIRDTQKESCLPSNDNEKFVFITNENSEGQIDMRLSSNVFYTNQHYRLRLLNGDFQNVYNVTFQIQNNKDRPGSRRNTALDFWIIGSDSAIRNRQSAEKYTSLLLSPAERLDILMEFDKDLFANETSEVRMIIRSRGTVTGPLMYVVKSPESPPSSDYSSCLSQFPFADYS